MSPSPPIAHQEASGLAAREAVARLDNCWNQIGIFGTGTCPELPKFIHCRNCPVYSKAGLELLNRPVPEGYRQQWTEHFAREKPTASGPKVSVLLFRIQAEWLALPAYLFQEVAERRAIHSLPHRRDSLVLGLANVRGELLICISLAHLLALEKAAEDRMLCRSYDRLLVVNWEQSRLVFPVDAVYGIHRLESQDLKEAPATVTRSRASYSRGVFSWKDAAVGLLDPKLLFPSINGRLE